jgi:hypothetical protein
LSQSRWARLARSPVAARGEAGSQIPLAMTQLFVAQAHEKVFDDLREMLMWMSQDEEWGRGLRWFAWCAGAAVVRWGGL